MSVWISTIAFSELAGMTRRGGAKALAAVISGSSPQWHGVNLEVRPTRTSRGGGRAGNAFEVRVDSLPVGLQQRWQEIYGDVEPALKVDNTTMAVCQWRYALIQPALAATKHSSERAQIVREIAGREHISPKGQRERVGERTLQRWIDLFEQPAPHGGFAALMRKKRAGSGEAAVIVSRAWDRAVPFEETVKHRVAHELRQYVRGLQKAGEALSFITPLAAVHLAELTRTAGFVGDDATLSTICAVPYGFIRAERAYRKVHTFKNDRSTYEDAKPRIQRSRAGLAPNDIWVGDVHPVDVLYRRQDGSTATLRAIAWLDLGTNRLHATWIALDKGQGGVRNTHVIRSFTAAVAAWGAPRALYLDNGSEYNWAEFIQDALKLIDAQGRRFVGDLAPWAERRSNVVKAMPYNAPAKPIENIFGVLERKHFSALPGWIGGDRMRKRTQNHGREPDPFPGTTEQLISLLDAQVAMYNAMPQAGRALDNRSPNDALAKAIEGGWHATAVNADALRVAFSTEEVRQVRQGCVQHKGLWTSRELQAYQGDTVTLLIPKYEDWARLPVRDEAGRIFTFVERDTAFGILDPAGAREADKRSRVHRSGVVALDRSAPDLDRLTERSRLAKILPDPPALPAPNVRLTGSTEAEDIAVNAGLAPDAESERTRRDTLRRDREEADAVARQATRQGTLAKILANRAEKNRKVQS